VRPEVRPEQGPAQPLPARATAIVLGLWVAGLLILAFVAVPLLFSLLGPPGGAP